MKLKYQTSDLLVEIFDKIIEYCDDPEESTRALVRIGLVFLQGQFGKSYHGELKKLIESVEPK